MNTYFAKKIFLEEGWAENAHISINKGSIAKISIEKLSPFKKTEITASDYIDHLRNII